MVIKINEQELELLSAFIYKNSGIVLDKSKAYLFESRLSPVMNELKISSYGELYNQILRDRTGKLTTKVIDAVCTNETYFFRDDSYFRLFVQKLLPDFFEANPSGTLKVWSAAASTGQEVYSLIMSLIDAGIDTNMFRTKFLATDISDKAIAKASLGEYTQFEISRGIPPNKLDKFFVPHGHNWRISDKVRSMVQFKKANLLDRQQLLRLGKFDIIYCRNVAIYFNREDRKTMFETLHEMLNNGGVLVIGATESLIGLTDKFTKMSFNGIVYYKKSE